ncbi:MAG: hypothetical protein B7X53_11195 [Hyphomonas sp. 34-62-18]|nr:thermonuclease family protein [Hyphomonas sp. 34-62-18]OZB15555.1 MAG: hypothetical protein B7X53_11195 [Hyphomonas sp. 34-62-18]
MTRKSNILEFRRPKRKFVAPGPVRGKKLRFSQRKMARAKVIGPAGGLAIWTAICLLLLAAVMFWEVFSPPSRQTLELAMSSAVEPGPREWRSPDRRFERGRSDWLESRSGGEDTAEPVSVTWVDGDSGWINGREFRLYGVDAPEGSPSRARCNEERALSAEAKAAARSLTSQGAVDVRSSMGTDKYGRELLSLSVDGKDVAASLVGRGHLQYWAYESGQKKPDWCS